MLDAFTKAGAQMPAYVAHDRKHTATVTAKEKIFFLMNVNTVENRIYCIKIENVIQIRYCK